MTRKVRILIEGSQSDVPQEKVTTSVYGKYRYVNGRHIISYEEASEDGEKPSRNMVKISSGLIEMKKDGINRTHMVFDLAGESGAVYQTPYGNLYFDIRTTGITVKEEEEELLIDMQYTLSHKDSHISDNQIRMVITSIKI